MGQYPQNAPYMNIPYMNMYQNIDPMQNPQGLPMQPGLTIPENK